MSSLQRRNSLCVGETPNGLCFGSLPGELPGRVRPIPDDQAYVIGVEDGRFWQKVQPILL